MSLQKRQKQTQKKDVLEAYPLRIHVNALPERRFFKMTRTLTITNCLLTLLLIALCFAFYYAMDHQDISIHYSPRRYALFRMNPEHLAIEQVDPVNTYASPTDLWLERQLTDYIVQAHKITWKATEQDSYYRREAPPSVIANLSITTVYQTIFKTQQADFQKLHAQGLIRDVHLYGLKQLYPGWWRGMIDTFDLPVDTRLESPCPCQDNSKECLKCKTQQATKQNRYVIWIRTSNNRKPDRYNPLGLSVNIYIPQWVPIHKDEIKWGIPPTLRPDI